MLILSPYSWTRGLWGGSPHASRSVRIPLHTQPDRGNGDCCVRGIQKMQVCELELHISAWLIWERDSSIWISVPFYDTIVHLVGFYHKKISRCMALWMSNTSEHQVYHYIVSHPRRHQLPCYIYSVLYILYLFKFKKLSVAECSVCTDSSFFCFYQTLKCNFFPGSTLLTIPTTRDDGAWRCCVFAEGWHLHRLRWTIWTRWSGLRCMVWTTT